jgi:small-conductance mechanosensitive channel
MGAMTCVLFLNLGTANVAPWWVTVLFLVLWVVLFAIAVRWFVPHPRRVPWLPAFAFVVWLPTIVLGTRQVGWG